MKITARELKALGIIDKIVGEKELLTPQTSELVVAKMKKGIVRFLKSYDGKSGEEIASERYERFRKY